VRYQNSRRANATSCVPQRGDVAAMKQTRPEVMEQEGLNVAYLATNHTQPPVRLSWKCARRSTWPSTSRPSSTRCSRARPSGQEPDPSDHVVL
jgi:hypothetical protein